MGNLQLEDYIQPTYHGFCNRSTLQNLEHNLIHVQLAYTSFQKVDLLLS